MSVVTRITWPRMFILPHNICAEHGGMSEDEAKEYVEQTLMREEKRYSVTCTD